MKQYKNYGEFFFYFRLRWIWSTTHTFFWVARGRRAGPWRCASYVNESTMSRNLFSNVIFWRGVFTNISFWHFYNKIVRQRKLKRYKWTDELIISNQIHWLLFSIKGVAAIVVDKHPILNQIWSELDAITLISNHDSNIWCLLYANTFN